MPPPDGQIFKNSFLGKFKHTVSMTVFISIVLIPGCKNDPDHYTRGIGIYPGDPREDFSPSIENGDACADRTNLKRKIKIG